MTHSPGMLAALILRRMRYGRLLLACVLAAVVVITTVVATLADFSARALPAAATRQLETASDTTIAISGTASGAQAKAAGALIAGSLRAALGGVPARLLAAQWSDPLSLPAAAGSSAIRTAQVAAMDGIASQARLVAGRWPAAPRPGQAAGIAIPAADAGPLGLRLGQRLTLTDSETGRPVALVVTGLWRAADPAAPYWRLDLLPASGESTVPGFQTYGPLIAAAGGFGSGGLTAGQQSWLAEPAVAAIGARQLPGLAARLGGLVARLRQAPNVGGLQVSTGLPQLLAGTATSYEVARSLLAMSAVELLLVAAAVLALAAALLASQRAEESALLTARGVTRRQIALLALAEAALLLGVAVAAGAALGYWLARPLSASGPLRASAASLAGAGAAAWWPAIVVLVLSVVILAWPAAVPGGAAGLLARGRRQPALALASRAGADLAILALAVVSGWQLRRYSVVARSVSGSIGIDPVLIAAPALILIGAALIPLRIMPSLARLGDRISARGHRLVAALATWEISRRPVRQAGPALLAILAVGTGVLALAQQQSWHESVQAQAAAAAGADVRVTVQPPATLPRAASVLTAPGVEAAMPVSQFNGGLGGSVLAIDAAAAARVVLLRSDQAQRPAAALWRLITPAGPARGAAVPGRPARLTLTTRLSGPLPGPAAVSVTVLAADGVAYTLAAGSLPPDGRTRVLTAVVPAAAQASTPLRLAGIALSYQLPPLPPAGRRDAAAAGPQHPAAQQSAPPPAVTLTITGLAAGSAGRPAGAPFAAGTALSGWRRQASSATLATNTQATGQQPAISGWQAAGSAQALTFRPGYGALFPGHGEPPLPVTGTVTLAAGQAAGPIPAIATTAFLASTGNKVGGRAIVAAGDYHLPVRIVAAVRSFPTAGSGGALIVDQQAAQALLAAQSGPPLPVTSWWLATTAGRVPAGLPASQVTSFRLLAARMAASPLAAAPQRAVLALIAAAALLAMLGFSVSVAASVSERRPRTALLSALGVTRIAQARQLCLEQALLAIPSALAGLAVGTIIAHLLVPAVTLTDQAARPDPPALVYVPAGWAIALAALVAAIPVLAAALTVLRKPDPAAELRAAAAT